MLMYKRKTRAIRKEVLVASITELCSGQKCFNPGDIGKALEELEQDDIIELQDDDMVELTPRGLKLSREWRRFLMDDEPVLEITAGLTDGSITSLIVILSSALIGNLTLRATLFAAFLTISVVAITNFSSFFLGGTTEDFSALVTLETLLEESLSDIPDLKERTMSLNLLGQLLVMFKGGIRRSNVLSATTCGVMTFAAGSIPVIVFLTLGVPLNFIISLGIVAVIVGIFLVKYRSTRSKVNWRITLLETLVIIAISVVISIVLGQAF